MERRLLARARPQERGGLPPAVPKVSAGAIASVEVATAMEKVGPISAAVNPGGGSEAVGSVVSLTILHDGSFDQTAEQLILFARDAEGRFVRKVHFPGRLVLGALFGEAEFSPGELTKEAFDERGRAIVQMLPRGRKTVIPVVTGTFEVQGEPMRYVPSTTSALP
jgi:hypothetical protein